jgi:hypothetical protein
MFAADIEGKKPDKERKRRLKETVECAHQLYAQRAALEGSTAAGLLDEQIAMIVAAEPVTPFARDLASVTGKATRQARQSAAS